MTQCGACSSILRGYRYSKQVSTQSRHVATQRPQIASGASFWSCGLQANREIFTVGLPGLEPGTLFLIREEEVFLVGSAVYKHFAYLRRFRCSWHPSFRLCSAPFWPGCCTVAAHHEVFRAGNLQGSCRSLSASYDLYQRGCGTFWCGLEVSGGLSSRRN
jgi:hypothetical protein